MSFDISTGLCNKIESHAAKLLAIKSKCEDSIDGLYDDLDTWLEPASDLGDSISEMTADAMGFTSDLGDTASQFTGSCFDKVIGNLLSAMGEFDLLAQTLLDDTLSGIAEKALSLLLESLKGLISGFNIPDIISDIDSLTNCLTDIEEIDTCLDSISSAISDINSVITYLHLDNEGNFDSDSFLSSVPGLDGSVKTNIQNISNKMDEVKSGSLEALSTAVAFAPSVVSENLF
jgi:hypothetical protein